MVRKYNYVYHSNVLTGDFFLFSGYSHLHDNYNYLPSFVHYCNIF